jgi:hypothetical protein
VALTDDSRDIEDSSESRPIWKLLVRRWIGTRNVIVVISFHD